ncbi:MAG: hypothetical protein VYE68_01435, partial [Acidobacteriota bacterium]|nr:hypothetical protein [Acidobacteriota bacterium]
CSWWRYRLGTDPAKPAVPRSGLLVAFEAALEDEVSVLEGSHYHILTGRIDLDHETPKGRMAEYVVCPRRSWNGRQTSTRARAPTT